MEIGSLQVDALLDGDADMFAGYFVGADWSSHGDMLNPDGSATMPIGAFLVQTGGKRVLIDVGIGPVDDLIDLSRGAPGPPRTMRLRGGSLPAALATLGLSPADIDVVLLTHLHYDHYGWCVQDGTPFFPNAEVRFGAADYAFFVTDRPETDSTRQMVSVLEAAGRVSLIDGDGPLGLPGISTLATPGHTPGHLAYVLSSGPARAMVLGDAVNCPVQLDAAEIDALGDLDRDTARKTRQRIIDELSGSDTMAAGPHFPGLRFGRLVTGSSARQWVVP
jgi:glyoxylase-like metal-dependent hydrolase (beta-lactamase superfamily II)